MPGRLRKVILARSSVGVLFSPRVRLRGEGQPIEPDPANVGVGNGSETKANAFLAVGPVDSAPLHSLLSFLSQRQKRIFRSNGRRKGASRVHSSKFLQAPIALTIAGSDSSGGAGIQADLKVFSALGVFGATAVTALTAQNTRGVRAVALQEPAFILDQIAAVLDDLEVRAVKIGMLASVPLIEATAKSLRHFKGPVVLDPVMVAKSGDRLLAEGGIEALKELLLPRVTVITPNLPEAACLLGRQEEAQNNTQQMAQGVELLKLGPQAVLMKGGHRKGDLCEDILLSLEEAPLTLQAPRLPTQNTHGTGCTLSAAIAAGLAKGERLAVAVRLAHGYLQGALKAADQLQVGQGHGPVHHFYELWGAQGL